MQILHCVDALYHLVCFGVAGTGCFFLYVVPLSEALVKAGLVVTKSLRTCLFTKDFIFPSLLKLSLAGYEILG